MTELVTVRLIADILGVPESADVVLEGLETDGVEIVESKLGEPAISAKDAKRTVQEHYAALAKLEAERRQHQWEVQ